MKKIEKLFFPSLILTSLLFFIFSFYIADAVCCMIDSTGPKDTCFNISLTYEECIAEGEAWGTMGYFVASDPNCSSQSDCNTPNAEPRKSIPIVNSIGTIIFNNPLGFDTAEGVLGSVLGALRKIIAILALVFIVIGGLLYITSTGNEPRIKMAKGAITASMIGLAIVIAAPSFLQEISTILGWTGASEAIPAGTLTIGQIALNVLNFLLSIIGIIAIIMLIVGGTMYITSAGDDDRIKAAKKIITYTIVGITVSLAALVIVNQIANVFK